MRRCRSQRGLGRERAGRRRGRVPSGSSSPTSRPGLRSTSRSRANSVNHRRAQSVSASGVTERRPSRTVSTPAPSSPKLDSANVEGSGRHAHEVALGKKHAPLDVEVLDRRRRQARAELLEEFGDLRSVPRRWRFRQRSPHAAVDAIAFQTTQCQMLDGMRLNPDVATSRRRVPTPKTIPASSSASSLSPVSRGTPCAVRGSYPLRHGVPDRTATKTALSAVAAARLAVLPSRAAAVDTTC